MHKPTEEPEIRLLPANRNRQVRIRFPYPKYIPNLSRSQGEFMTLKELEKIVTEHLIQSTGIVTRLDNVDSKVNWILGLIACVFVALLGMAFRGN